jgi:uroporphyrinogen III methyltransferase/synthase
VGSVVLVGAGPGDPGLLTVRGREEVSGADVVVIDRLVSPEIVALARPDARVVYVGKAPGAHTADQAEIDALLVREARAGNRVVRLKGGDPYLFGRGGEEAVACAAAGLPCTVVPGVSSALAVPAAAGVPVTHRGISQAVTVVSGHLAPGHPGSAVNWEALAASGASLVVLMGVGNLGKISIFLQEHGRAGTTPVTVIERGTTAGQRVVRSTLAEIEAAARRTRLRSPAVIVIGEVAGLELAGSVGRGAAAAGAADESASGLAGARVLLPRSRSGPSSLAGLLRAAGAEVVEVRVLAPAVDAAQLPEAGWLEVPDAAAAEALQHGLRAAARDARSLCGLRVAGPADALAVLGLLPDAAAAPAGAPAVGRELPIRLRRVALPPAVATAVAAGEIDAVALASSGTARALGEELARLVPAGSASGAGCAVAAIGPRTAAAAKHSGLAVGAVAAGPDLASLTATLAVLTAARDGSSQAGG